MKYVVFAIIVSINCQGCGFYMLSKMAGLCARNGGVEEVERDGSYIRVKCRDGKTRSRYVQ